MDLILIIMAALFITEQVFLYRWNPTYFTTGLRIFSVSLPAPSPSPARARLTLNTLERDVAPLTWVTLTFHTLPGGKVAFRESFAPNATMRRYFPVMRGLVEVDIRAREVRVVGLCNWTVPVFLLGLLILVGMRPAAAPILALPIVFVIGYAIQRRAYLHVVDALREQLSGDPPMLLRNPVNSVP